MSGINDSYVAAREAMVREQLEARGITSPAVLKAMREVPRHLFVSREWVEQAYDDCALPSQNGQTISQPYVVAAMTEALDIRPQHRVLEIGTGTGYQTAILARLAGEVYTIERLSVLAEGAWGRLEGMGISNVHSAVGDGSLGWHWAMESRLTVGVANWREVKGAFDGILVTAGSPEEPGPLVEQLAVEGVLIIPTGTEKTQTLVALRRRSDGRIERRELMECRFVSLIGRHGWREGSG